ncbi:hypothetical protein JKF63_00079 [Porcisia hertigi]|uniref:C2 domain-containing protein n=1 Tax=Porcisia hertigi TaxID=2761500 RepID=A0A836HAY9_9TRYP|nr:hypothetical protein JKF63_00079 [Porcisia hertigi]
MPRTEVGMDGREIGVRLPPGIYRTASSVSPMDTNCESACASTGVPGPEGITAVLADTRHRFRQLRELRRELSGRPLPNPASEAAAAAGVLETLSMRASSASPPLPTTDFPAQAPPSLTCAPTAVSFGLPLDRLPADDPVTRSVLRTAAAERALRLQQIENDELKRAILVQRLESAEMQSVIDRLSSELTATGQTVLRQTATMKSLAAEMERQDAYHLIKERRSSRAEAAALVAAGSSSGGSSAQPLLSHPQPVQLTQQMEKLASENAALRQQVSDLSLGLCGKLRGTPGIEQIDKEEDAAEGEIGSGRWLRLARAELQRLVHALAAILLGDRLALGRARVDTERVYEVELSGMTCLAPLDTQRNSKDASFPPARVNRVVCVFGPYNMDDLLLRFQAVAEDAGASTRSARKCAKTSAQVPQSCTLYAMRDTCGRLSISLYEDVVDRQARGGPSRSTDTSAPAATATVAIRTLIATALADSRDFSTVATTSGVHTVHLATDKGVPIGTATFRVRVTELQHQRYRGYGDVNGLTDSAGRQRPSPCLPHIAGADSVSKQPHRGQSRGCMLSPSRDDDFTPVNEPPPSVHSSDCPRTPLPAPAGDAKSGRSSEAPPGCVLETGGCQTNLLPVLSAASGDSQKTVRNPVEAVPSVGMSTTSEVPLEGCEPLDKSETASTAPAKTTRIPLGSASVPLPPHVSVPSPPPSSVALLSEPAASSFSVPPPPPAALVPAPPPSSTPPTAPLALPTSAIRIHIKEVRDLCECRSGEAVEDMLNDCFLCVVVLIDGEPVFTAPRRWNSMHTVWSAAEGTWTSALSIGQEVRFEVRNEDMVRCQASLPASEILDTRGEREVALVSASGGNTCGLLTLDFKGPV